MPLLISIRSAINHGRDRHSRESPAPHGVQGESGHPGVVPAKAGNQYLTDWIPPDQVRGRLSQARNDRTDRTYVLVYKLFHLFPVLFLGLLIIPGSASGQIINPDGWAVPDLRGLVPHSITVRTAGGVEKIVEKFYTPDGGHVAKIRGNGKVFAYAVDSDREPPIDFLILDPDGSGKFIQKFGTDDFYPIPEWVSQ